MRPLDWALSPAIARPRVSASSRSNPSRSATTAAHSVSTGARLMRIRSVGAAVRPAAMAPVCPLLDLERQPARGGHGGQAREVERILAAHVDALAVPQVAPPAHLLAFRVVDPDLGAHVALVVA